MLAVIEPGMVVCNPPHNDPLDISTYNVRTLPRSQLTTCFDFVAPYYFFLPTSKPGNRLIRSFSSQMIQQKGDMVILWTNRSSIMAARKLQSELSTSLYPAIVWRGNAQTAVKFPPTVTVPGSYHA